MCDDVLRLVRVAEVGAMKGVEGVGNRDVGRVLWWLWGWERKMVQLLCSRCGNGDAYELGKLRRRGRGDLFEHLTELRR